MRLSAEVMLEIVSIFQDGLFSGTDVSQRLRELDLDARSVDDENKNIFLSDEYKKLNKKE